MALGTINDENMGTNGNIKIDNTKLEVIKSIKYLGMIIDDKLCLKNIWTTYSRKFRNSKGAKQ